MLPIPQSSSIWLPSGNQRIQFNKDLIVYLEADNQYTHVYYVLENQLSGVCSEKEVKQMCLQRQTLCVGMCKLEKKLLPFGFCRVHRSYMVNMGYVMKYLDTNGGLIVLINQKEIVVTEGYKAEFRRMSNCDWILGKEDGKVN